MTDTYAAILAALVAKRLSLEADIERFSQAKRDIDADLSDAKVAKDKINGEIGALLDADGVRSDTVLVGNRAFAVTRVSGALGVEIEDESAIPFAFIRTVESPDKNAIKQALADGKIVPGAKLAKAPDTISIKAKDA